MLIFVAIIIVLLSILTFFIVEHFMGVTILREIKSMDRIMDNELEVGIIDKDFLESLREEKVQIKSKDNLLLKGRYIKGDKNKDKTIIISHGITSGIPASYKYARPFIEKGWNALLIYHRRHIESEGKYSTMGYYEKYDLLEWIKFIRKKNGGKSIVGIHGESMGASTALLATDLGEPVDFVVADCGFSDLDELFIYKNKENKFVGNGILKVFYSTIKWKAKFDIKEVKPLKAAINSKVPVLFIHGEADKFVPTYMSKDMFERSTGYKEIYLVPNAVHAKSIMEDYSKYKNIMMSFVDKVIDEK